MSEASGREGALDRVGRAALVATVSACLASLPAALRLSHLSPSITLTAAWSLTAVCALPPSLVLRAMTTAAAPGLRAWASESVHARALFASLWLASMTLALARFGALLRRTTHHHALAGVTFALGALALGVASAALLARLVSLARRSKLGTQAAWALFVSLAALDALSLRAGLSTATPLARGTALDVLALGVATVVGALAPPMPKPVVRAGPLLIVLLVATAWLAVRSCPEVAAAMPNVSPLFAPLLPFR